MSSRYEYAGFWIRFLATILDTLIIGIPLAIISILIFGMPNPEEPQLTASDFFSNIIWVIICIVCWIKFAATPGKLILKLKVLDANTGDHLSIGQAFLRYIAYIPSTLVLFLGFIWIGFDKHKQGWHDKIAKTVVVKDHRA